MDTSSGESPATRSSEPRRRAEPMLAALVYPLFSRSSPVSPTGLSLGSAVAGGSSVASSSSLARRCTTTTTQLIISIRKMRVVVSSVRTLNMEPFTTNISSWATEDSVDLDGLEDYLEAPGAFSSMLSVFMGFGYILYAIVIVLGVPCNLFVLFRMQRLAKDCSEVYSNGTGICLFTMAIADLISLSSITVHYILSFNLIPMSQFLHNATCKMVIFSTHVSTSVSIWCWLLMSMLRYLSVYYPLLYMRLWRLPIRVLLFVLSGSSITNFWLLFAVIFAVNPEVGCTQRSLMNNPAINKAFLLTEICWSFCLPTAVIVFVDTTVYMCRSSLHTKTPRLMEMMAVRKNCSSARTSSKKALWRWLVIALIDIGLNAPENLNRMAVILGLVDVIQGNEIYLLVRVFSQVLYYFQFGFNGVYLALFIYDKSTQPKNRGDSKKKERKKPSCEAEVSFVPELPTTDASAF
ncbi:hypothetical protein QR680_001422 [Steinernema hermaphroditum]|uniref:G-protein coupled receptors family 1 profile domain-containing protein n=1 Tax=Steinernema hermaphroditum TaxID=289476 RepID=A0AA39GZ00_9BILA|nr:hypothetical protein QR680_001422 [Steinernema hermaphroditum]